MLIPSPVLAPLSPNGHYCRLHFRTSFYLTGWALPGTPTRLRRHPVLFSAVPYIKYIYDVMRVANC